MRIYIDIEMKKLTLTLLISLAVVVACGGQKSANNDKVTPGEAKPKRVFAELLD